MSTPRTYEIQLLEPAENFLCEAVCGMSCGTSFEFKFQILEATASLLGGFSLEQYNAAFGIEPVGKYQSLLHLGKSLVGVLGKIAVHPAFALSALAREPVDSPTQRNRGVYYTDFRLAQHLANLVKEELFAGRHVVDPASGTGMLLAACLRVACGDDRSKSANWLASSAFACDLSSIALRGARLALAANTNDIGAIASMWANWRIQDSLVASNSTWESLSRDGFDVVIGNPPWEKVKLTRHEYLQANGVQRHYGAEYGYLDSNAYHAEQKTVSEYAQDLAQRYKMLRAGEPDLYIAFVELCLRLVRPGGALALLVPAGLIRSKGTEALRRLLVENSQDLSITVMENRARFFAIDTRFKFVSLKFVKSSQKTNLVAMPIRVYHATGNHQSILQTGIATMDRATLYEVRRDLTIPEVRSNREWEIFLSMSRRGIDWSAPESSWHPHIVREIDMTRDRPFFSRDPSGDALPVIEGRMVQSHRFGSKAYIGGTGRSALWSPIPVGESKIAPQFWINSSHLRPGVIECCRHVRAGFCDIAGQTNERSMMAALIPPKVVCGNKVPTVVFPKDPSEERLLLWVGIANSLPFDWLLRRVLTTTVNYFLLLAVPIPPIEPGTESARLIIEAARRLRGMDLGERELDVWKMAELRADIDLEVLTAYGLGYDALELMLQDFPLLDREQPPIDHERSSTITRDFLLERAAGRFCLDRRMAERVKASRSAEAYPYITSGTPVPRLVHRREAV